MKLAPKVAVTEIENEGFVSLLEKNVTLFCMVYIYTGKLVGVNDKFVKLENPKVVYETGPFNEKNWKDAQQLPHDLYVMLSSIESFCVLKGE